MGSLSERDKKRLRSEGFTEQAIDLMDKFSTGVDRRPEPDPDEDVDEDDS